MQKAFARAPLKAASSKYKISDIHRSILKGRLHIWELAKYGKACVIVGTLNERHLPLLQVLAVLLQAGAIGIIDGVQFDKIGDALAFRQLYDMAMSFKIEEFALGFETFAVGGEKIDGKFTK